MTSDTLTAIDAALEAWENSEDVMSWPPQRVICDGGGPLPILPRPPQIKARRDWLDAMVAAYALHAKLMDRRRVATLDASEPC